MQFSYNVQLACNAYQRPPYLLTSFHIIMDFPRRYMFFCENRDLSTRSSLIFIIPAVSLFLSFKHFLVPGLACRV